MDDESPQPNRGTKAFDVGEVAVENSERPSTAAASSSESQAPPESAPPIYLKEHPSLESEVLEPGEHLICIVRRHPIGLVAIYLEALAALAAIFALMLVVAPSFTSSSSGRYDLAFTGLFIVAVLAAIILGFTTYIYRKSRLFVTDRSLVEILQRGLFNRKVSRLSMADVEDVSSEKKGIFPMMFNFGTLMIQTAGEMDNFLFPMCPDPDEYSSLVLEARQAYEAHSGRQSSKNN